MAIVYGLPIISIRFHSDTVDSVVGIGDPIRSIQMKDGRIITNATLRGVELDARVNQNSQSGAIYDSIPVNGYVQPSCGMAKADSTDFDVSRIVVTTSGPFGMQAHRLAMRNIMSVQLESQEVIDWKNDTNSYVTGTVDGLTTRELSHCEVDSNAMMISMTYNVSTITDFAFFDALLATPGITRMCYTMDEKTYIVNIDSDEQNNEYAELKKGVQDTMPTVSGDMKTGTIAMENKDVGAELVYTLKVKYYNEKDIVAKIGDVGYGSIDSAIAAAKAGNTITLQKSIEVDNVGKDVTPKNGLYKIPAGVTFDGGGYTITAKEDTWLGGEVDDAKNHIFEMSSGTSKIRNLTVIGHKKVCSAVVCFGAGTNATIENLTVQNMGHVGVQIVGAKVSMTDVNTKGNTWGGINVDRASDGTMPYATFNSGTLEENVEIYTEITEQNVITAPGMTKYQGYGDILKGFIFYTSDVKRLGVVLVGTDKVYETLNLAVVAKPTEQVTLLDNVTEDITIPVGSALKVKGSTKDTTIFGTVRCNAIGAENTKVELSNLTLDGEGKREFGIISQNQTDDGQMELTLELYGIVIKNYTGKGIYATNLKKMGYSGVLLQDCATGIMNQPNTRGDYAIDLNLVAVQDALVNINNSYFRGDLGDIAAIKVSQRGGASDADANDIPKNVGEAKVKVLLVTGSEYTATTPVFVQVGSTSKTAGDVVNSTAKFPAKVLFNDNEVTVNVASAADDQGKLVVPAGRDATKTADEPLFTLVPTPEEVVDDALTNMDGVDVVDEGGNTFSITTSDGKISESGLFDKIAEIRNLESIVVSDTDGHTETYVAADSDLDAFKAAVDAMLPKDIGSGTVVLTMTVNLQ